ncbi:MAG: hypothetical protein KGZ97_12030 [Bacteroidetes bacterium]|nr:hypothetical protein [Bacteroidota bacterium]
MTKKIDDRESFRQIFKPEFERIDRCYRILELENLSFEMLKIEFADLINAYSSLLNDTLKMTRIGDKTQSKLVKAREEIEQLNEKLQESERNIKELNTILMHYIDATEKK